MTEKEQIMMACEIEEVLARYDITLTDLITLADRLLCSAFKNIEEQNPDVDIEKLAHDALQIINKHILQPFPELREN